ncbi:hypothetical protein KGQ20_32465 [Catenulispora sp. NF23]|uniref:Lipoprotein n=1 Tax=Catenulispora pinistramenti TaxID=2705254 RepID=A0ABS5L547_9ACTN|nr:hypothetical protein [Catenulispora pinistramenti]MBS2537479.1 hypothetical protein [Catenulispora pinistramenti]MBS2553352.1 hypothetical protein [Catenulispora pinistramenti]
MTGRLRASVIPGLLASTALALTACASQGTIAASASGGTTAPGTSGSSTPAPATSGGAPGSVGGSQDSAAPSTPAGGSSPSTESSAALASSIKSLNDTWTDPGCKTALAGFSGYLFAQQAGLLQGVAALPGAIQQVRAGSSQTRKPQAAVAMNRMVNDMTAMQNQAKQGQKPSPGPLKSDFQTMGTVCSQQP